ncbi:MAG TPA: YbaK/EbsC family protein [Burkholderiales bacterium]|nr:YbaK/EbsC family protein [Burkholderiales bacterium]
MSMAFTLERYLQAAPAPFDLLSHRHTMTSLEAARVSQVRGTQLAKAVLVEDEAHRYLMAVLPATKKVELASISAYAGCEMHLASETEFKRLFADCESGAVPPLGSAYDMPTIWDKNLLAESDLFFEAGDHETLIHMKTSDFIRLLGDADPLDFAAP